MNTNNTKHPNNTTSRYQLRGFTLVELMITLVIAAILATVAVPSFSSTIKNNRFTTQTNNLISNLNYARSEAIRRGARITISSATTNWHDGWSITDEDGNTLRIKDALEGSSELTGSSNTLTFLSTGFLEGTAVVTYTLCDDRTAETGRVISVSPTGRPSTSSNTCS